MHVSTVTAAVRGAVHLNQTERTCPPSDASTPAPAVEPVVVVSAGLRRSAAFAKSSFAGRSSWSWIAPVP